MKRRTKSGLVWLLVLLLFISVCVTVIALTSRFQNYIRWKDHNSMIPLAPDVSDTSSVDTSFSVSDDKTVWSADTETDIFYAFYKDGKYNIAAVSEDGEAIIAPGTENTYIFKLRNDYTVPLEYSVVVKLSCTPEGTEIPILCRLSRYDGKWIAGDSDSWEDVSQFNGTTDTAILATQSYVTYTLDWMWPYEGDDAEDSLLGHQASMEDLHLSVEIGTSAEAVIASEILVSPGTAPDAVQNEGHPMAKPVVGEALPLMVHEHNDSFLWIFLALLLLIQVLLLLFLNDEKKAEKRANTEANEREEVNEMDRV